MYCSSAQFLAECGRAQPSARRVRRGAAPFRTLRHPPASRRENSGPVLVQAGMAQQAAANGVAAVNGGAPSHGGAAANAQGQNDEGVDCGTDDDEEEVEGEPAEGKNNSKNSTAAKSHFANQRPTWLCVKENETHRGSAQRKNSQRYKTKKQNTKKKTEVKPPGDAFFVKDESGRVFVPKDTPCIDAHDGRPCTWTRRG